MQNFLPHYFLSAWPCWSITPLIHNFFGSQMQWYNLCDYLRAYVFIHNTCILTSTRHRLKRALKMTKSQKTIFQKVRRPYLSFLRHSFVLSLHERRGRENGTYPEYGPGPYWINLVKQGPIIGAPWTKKYDFFQFSNCI